jgi:hypothetical protein
LRKIRYEDVSFVANGVRECGAVLNVNRKDAIGFGKNQSGSQKDEKDKQEYCCVVVVVSHAALINFNKRIHGCVRMRINNWNGRVSVGNENESRTYFWRAIPKKVSMYSTEREPTKLIPKIKVMSTFTISMANIHDHDDEDGQRRFS